MVSDLQKASLWKRISAFLFDFILLCVVAVFFAMVVSWVTGYDNYQRQFNTALERISAEYGINLNMSAEEQASLSPEQNEQLENAYAALQKDEAALRAYSMIQTLTQLILSLGILLACLIMEFLIPLKLKDGRTFGKKLFGLAVMQTNSIKISTVSLFIRTFLGKFAIEIMIPVLIIQMVFWGTIGIIAPIILFLILIVQVSVMCVTPTNSLIHDLLANTVVVDYLSQMIFDTPEAMIAYKEKAAAEKAQREPY